MRSLWLIILLSLTVGIALAGTDGGNRRPMHLLIIDSERGEPYKTIREQVLRSLESKGYKPGSGLTVKHYSIGNFQGTVRNIFKVESDQRYDVVILNGTLAVMGAKTVAMNDPRYRFVFGGVTDPVGIGVIDAFNAPPKANFTGVAYPVRVEARLRFIMQSLPHAHRIGLIYADMPQSHSYNAWLDAALEQEAFKHLQLITRQVSFVPSEGGHIRMARLARQHILELNDQVDVFISPNDQMGVQRPFVDMMARYATKPLVGLGKREVTERWGATMSIFPSMESTGRIVTEMVEKLYLGSDIQSLPPVYPDCGVAYDKEKVRRFKVQMPPSQRDCYPVTIVE